jgi:hypothetical protein
MSDLPVIRPRQLIRALERAGFFSTMSAAAIIICAIRAGRAYWSRFRITIAI